jgi:hypothetical protein
VAATVGCVAGALSISEYRDGLAAAGFTDITITPTHQVTDGPPVPTTLRAATTAYERVNALAQAAGLAG